jgi:short-subunit dehydrogenase
LKGLVILMMDKCEKIVLITGASSGIGAATAKLLAKRCMTVILIARREDRLKDLTAEICRMGGKASFIPADLTLADERRRVYDSVIKRHGQIDVLINNAGVGYYGYASEMPWLTAYDLIRLNIEALVQLTLMFLPHMQKRGTGHIINISSIAGGLPNQGIALYGASKAFVNAFSTSLYRELKGTPVHTSTVRPGAVTTEFFDRAQLISFGGRRTPGEGSAVTPDKVARRIYKLLDHPRRVVYVPRIMVLSSLLEILFGWAIDLIGPVLLKRQKPSVSMVQAQAVPVPVGKCR